MQIIRGRSEKIMGDAVISRYIPMIEKVVIENFKGIKHSEIDNLGKVNLFIGRNGCGKSSIMEAIYYTGKEFIKSSLPQCIRRRVNRGSWSARELWYNYHMSPNVDVRLEFSGENLTGMIIRFSPEDKRVHVSLRSSSPSARHVEHVGCQYQVSDFAVYVARAPGAISSPHSKQIKEYFDRSVFVDPSIKTDIRQIEGSYLNVLKLSEKDSSSLAKRTAEIYETEPSWEFLPHQDFPPDTPSRFAILEGERRLFFDNFGDGLHYGVAILSIAKTRNNTALFIEEIESHQHPEAIKNLISNLLDIAKMNKIQLFITTHNQNVWRYLHYYYENPEERKKEFRCFHVIKDKDSGEVEAKIEEGIVNIQPDLHGEPQ